MGMTAAPLGVVVGLPARVGAATALFKAKVSFEARDGLSAKSWAPVIVLDSFYLL